VAFDQNGNEKVGLKLGLITDIHEQVEHLKTARIFNAVPNRLILAGHYHKWLLVTPDRIIDWSGDVPVNLADGRYFVVVGALCEGHYAILDTSTSELLPFNEESA
jgi:hypothetical protein